LKTELSRQFRGNPKSKSEGFLISREKAKKILFRRETSAERGE